MPKKGGGVSYYAVRTGRHPGIYNTWGECEDEIKGFKGAKYKKFPTLEEAEEFINGESSSTSVPVKSPAKQLLLESSKSSGLNADGTLSLRSLAGLRSLTERLSSSVSVLGEHVYDGSKILASLQKNTAQDSTTSETLQSFDVVLTKAEGHIESLQDLVTKTKELCKGLVGSSRKRSVEEESSNGGEEPKKAKKETTRQTNSENKVAVVYTDGCCHDNGRGNPRAGIGVYWGDDHPNNLAEKLHGRQTNNCAEIEAARQAVIQAKDLGFDKIVINTDSQFVINCITKWIKKWKKNDWKLSSGGTVINREELEKLDEAIKDIEVEWKHVKGHAGIHGNEEADRLANEGARKPY